MLAGCRQCAGRARPLLEYLKEEARDVDVRVPSRHSAHAPLAHAPRLHEICHSHRNRPNRHKGVLFSEKSPGESSEYEGPEHVRAWRSPDPRRDLTLLVAGRRREASSGVGPVAEVGARGFVRNSYLIVPATSGFLQVAGKLRQSGPSLSIYLLNYQVQEEEERAPATPLHAPHGKRCLVRPAPKCFPCFPLWLPPCGFRLVVCPI